MELLKSDLRKKLKVFFKKMPWLGHNTIDSGHTIHPVISGGFLLLFQYTYICLKVHFSLY
jgi:hypothetical protein